MIHHHHPTHSTVHCRTGAHSQAFPACAVSQNVKDGLKQQNLNWARFYKTRLQKDTVLM